MTILTRKGFNEDITPMYIGWRKPLFLEKFAQGKPFLAHQRSTIGLVQYFQHAIAENYVDTYMEIREIMLW